MASFVRRAMVYLGLTDDDYDDYEGYDESELEAAPARSQVRSWPAASDQAESSSNAVRTVATKEPPAPVVAPPRPSVVRPIASDSPKVHVVAPTKFSDAQEIGDRFRGNQPVIVNLQMVDRDLARRMIDFCSGVTYALGGAMDKVADQVFLLTPSNVEVSAEERQRLSERGLYRS